MNERNKARIKELYFQHPEISGQKAAKMLGLPVSEVLVVMKKLGYTAKGHEKARQAVLKGEKPESPMKMAEKPQVEKKPIVSVPNGFSHMPSPETVEHRREVQLFKNANALLQKAEKAAQNGDIETYLKLRKEYEVAARQAEAYKKRGTLNKSEREISGIENQYQICR
jgi:hypothetical protein